MIGRLNHVAIAVPNIEQAADQYRNALGAKVGAPQDQPEHGVKVIFIELDNGAHHRVVDRSPGHGAIISSPVKRGGNTSPHCHETA